MQFDNFIIRQLELDDLNEYFYLIENNRKRLEDFFTGTVSRTKTFDETKVFLEEIIEKRNQKLYYPFIIIDTDTEKIAGFFDLKNIDWNIPKAEVGSYTDEKYADKGITAIAFAIFIDYCFEHFGFKKIFLRTHVSNIAAQKLAAKTGFEIEGIIRKDYKTTSGEIVDLIYFGRLAD